MCYEDLDGISRRYYIDNKDGSRTIIGYNAHNFDEDRYGNIDFIEVDFNRYRDVATTSFQYYNDENNDLNLFRTK
mgnify:FL=1